jgi:hypothetical protein
MKRIEDLGPNDVIHCPTQEEFNRIIAMNPGNQVEENKWLDNREKTYYKPHYQSIFGGGKGTYCYLDYAKEKGYSIHQAKDFLEPSYTDLIEQAKELAKQEGIKLEVVLEQDWEGVEFFKSLMESDEYYIKHKIYRASQISGDAVCFIDENKDDHKITTDYLYENFRPSTEQAYKEQLIKEAKERFGEIKGGDVFFSVNNLTYTTLNNIGFSYFNRFDRLTFGGVTIYEKGKWSERVEEKQKEVREIIINGINEDDENSLFDIFTNREVFENPFISGKYLIESIEIDHKNAKISLIKVSK